MGYLEDRIGLKDKVAVVVGGAGGLGQASVDELTQAGVKVAVCDRDRAALDATARRVEERKAEVMTVEGDARDPEVLEELFQRANETFGRLDALVNVVGGTFRQSFVDTNARGWDALVRTNFTWMLTSTQLAVPYLRASGGGSIVNFTSIEAHRAAPGFSVYAAMKAGVNSFTRTMAVELAGDGIRVNALAADLVPTEALSGISDPYDDMPPDVASFTIPMGRTGTYADVGGCVLFLVSDLSAYVTGTTVHVDGGTFASSGWFNFPDTGWLNVPSADMAHRIASS